MRSTSLTALTAGVVLQLLAASGRSQGTRADYERADALPARCRDKVVGGGVRPHWSPDGRWLVVRQEHNLRLRDRKSGEEFALTDDGSEADGYERGVVWSPDSTKLVALKTAQGDDRKVYLIESSPRDQVQPKLSSYN